MHRKIHAAFLTALIATGSYAMHAFAAEENVQMKDPPRWHSEDMSPRARFNNMTKEANAAYQQSLNECRSLRNRELAACRNEAKSNLASDMQRAHRVLARQRADSDME
ncbi:hypothetical protein QN360_10070 [Glaciimonas sp. CA11.2]|uniref:hypothetical protein n=1 Tax=unclassified Glaciimonas TaxID=2644401 RepID=UPI002AB36BB8|nr:MULTISPECIES: hypothetical protein [unclassified Glaciimonas]MDY7547192.1 hypothetical protein [Glaciimonas sp. CA11.2]MEB0014435.1 hypothetical protein [Glaciimonas sp. Cout2]MEB0083305.1 hypothetical protein [Glaciimonas sp. Gout2]MEB0163254.1 hypothetical protein [Glaciimonas sp. CA11.2]